MKPEEELFQSWKQQIDLMSHEDMAKLWRFAPNGHPVFCNSNKIIYNYFMRRFNELGGMTPKISKKIGW